MLTIPSPPAIYQIQEATLEQASEITQVINDSFERVEEYYYQPGIKRTQPEDIHNQIQDRENYRVFVALVKTDQGALKIVGTGCLYIPGIRGNVYRLCAAEDWRGCGIGSALLQKIEQCAKKLGLPATILDINNDTREEALRKFYEKNGYRFLRTDFSYHPEKFLFRGE